MKLRTRLFLWVGTIFFVAFGASLVFETQTTDHSLKKSEKDLRKEILQLNEKKRENMEHFLHISLSEDQAQIDSLLLRIARDPKFGGGLFIEPENINLIAPAHAAYMYKSNKWIDFIQTTKEGRLTSLLIPIDYPMETVHNIPIDEKISWVVLDTDEEIKKPLIGVRLKANPKRKESLAMSIDEMIEVDWGLTVLFDPAAIEDWKKPPPLSQEEIEEVDLANFLIGMAHAAEYLKGKSSKEWVADIRKRAQPDFFKNVPFDLEIQCLHQDESALNNQIIQQLQKGDQAVMIGALSSLFPTGEFGLSPFSKEAPKGIARFPIPDRAGHAVFTSGVFFQKKICDDAAYFEAHPSEQNCEGVGNFMTVISSPLLDRVFVGNTLLLKGEKGEGYLTIGLDVDSLLLDLVLSINQDAFLVHDEKVISAYSEDGKKMSHTHDDFPFKKSMLKQTSGVVDWKEETYYFLQMTPFKNLDLHFFILKPEEKAFALVNSVDEGSREVLKKVSFNMRIIAVIALAFVLILLHKVAKRITKPIASLARLTKDVASGRLEGIEMPEMPKGRHDEITTLCDSFCKMVIGLKEKEKVKGVLNKVVSPEIAQEITKGTIQLGGEERKVTVFFADIRNFTRMSAKKDPKEVVEMLNTCMTKISHKIDEFGGVIDKYVGDEVMALFGAPLEKEDSALKAIQCALETIKVLKEWNKEREAGGLHSIEMGFGIHTGNVLVGNMGAENRLNYTVIGSNVNFANRLCSAAGPMEILISKETLAETHVAEHIEVQEHTAVELKGYEESFVVYTVKGAKDVR